MVEGEPVSGKFSSFNQKEKTENAKDMHQFNNLSLSETSRISIFFSSFDIPLGQKFMS
jgi:hypothetical protein